MLRLRRWGPFLISSNHAFKYLPILGRFVSDEDFFTSGLAYVSSNEFSLKQLVVIFENTLLYTFIGFLSGVVFRAYTPPITLSIFAVMTPIEYWSTRKNKVHAPGWSALGKMPPDLALKTFLLVVYHAYLYLLLGFALYLIFMV